MKLRELQKEFEKKGVKYTQFVKGIKEYFNGKDEKVKDGIVVYKCSNLSYLDEYFEVFRYRIAKPHPYDAENWDMVELYPSDEAFGVWAWSCIDKSSVEKIVKKHFEDSNIILSEIL